MDFVIQQEMHIFLNTICLDILIVKTEIKKKCTDEIVMTDVICAICYWHFDYN